MAWHRRLFYVLLVLVPTQLGFHFWPEWAYVVGRRVDYLSPTVHLTDVLIFFAVIKLLISDFTRLRKIRNVQILVLLAAINIFFAGNQPVALYAWLKVFEFAGLGWYIVRTKTTWEETLPYLSIGIIGFSVLAITQFTFHHSIGGILWWFGERSFSLETPGIARINICLPFTLTCRLMLRSYATFPHPNVMGGFVAALLPMLIHFSFPLSPRHWYTYLYRAACAFGAVALFFSFSRSAFFVVGIGLGCVYWIRQSLPIRAIAALIIFLSFVYVLWRIPARTDESVARRIELTKASLTMITQAPVTGVGMGNFVLRLPEVTRTRQGNFLQPVHSIYLLFTSEMGIVGIVTLGWIVVKWCRTATRGRRKFQIISLLPLMTVVLLGCVDHYPVTLQQGQLLLAITASLFVSEHS